MKNKKFSEKFKDVREKFPSIKELDKEKISFYDEELKISSITDTSFYIIYVISFLILVTTYPLFVGNGYYLVDSFETQIAPFLDQKNLLESHYELKISLGLFLFVAISYTVITPILMHIDFFRRRVELFTRKFGVSTNTIYSKIEYKSLRFILLVFFTNYVSLFIGFIYLYSYSVFSNVTRRVLFDIYLMVPVCISGLFPTIIFLLLLSIFFSIKEEDHSSSFLPDIISKIVDVILQVEKAESSSSMDNHQREQIVTKIASISVSIQNLYLIEPFNNPVSVWSKKEMVKVSLNFLQLGSWIYFPQQDTKDFLIEKLITYLNIFISGDFHYLPKEEVSIKEGEIISEIKLSGFKKLYMFCFIATYLIFPIFLLFVIVGIYKVEFHPLIQSALSVFYIIWVILGLLSFSDKFNPELKDLFFEIVKSVVGRK